VLWPVTPTGWFYPAVAITLGIVFLVEAYDLKSRAMDTEDLAILKPMRLFHYSNAYLALLFVAALVVVGLVVHRVLRGRPAPGPVPAVAAVAEG
jgi:heme O synthase-like polyprenyltransferase